jgi:hypothetical protein
MFIIYKAEFPESAAGEEVIVRDAAGEVITTATLGEASGGRVLHVLAREDATAQIYTGTVNEPFDSALQPTYQVDLVASLRVFADELHGRGGIGTDGASTVVWAANPDVLA